MNAIQARKIYKSINRRTLSYTQLKTVLKCYTLLEGGVCSCAELQVFLVTEAERNNIRQHPRFRQHRDAPVINFFSCKERHQRKIMPL